MGDERVTVKKLQVVRADAERNLLLVRGVGPRGAPRARPREDAACIAMPALSTASVSAASRRPRCSIRSQCAESHAALKAPATTVVASPAKTNPEPGSTVRCLLP